MVAHLVDCPSCACLIDPAESACPFCGAAQRRTSMPAVLTLGLLLGLASVSCSDKPEPTTMTTTSPLTTSTTADTDTTTTTTEGDTLVTVDDGGSVGPVAAYAGPPETDEESVSISNPTDFTTSSTTSTGTEATTSDDDATFGGVTAYAGAPADPPDHPEDVADR